MRSLLSAAVGWPLWRDASRLFGGGLGASAALALAVLLWTLPVPPAAPLIEAATAHGQELARLRRRAAPRPAVPPVIAGGCDPLREVCALRPRPTDEPPPTKRTALALPDGASTSPGSER